MAATGAYQSALLQSMPVFDFFHRGTDHCKLLFQLFDLLLRLLDFDPPSFLLVANS
jgi:hypothetical protein